MTADVEQNSVCALESIFNVKYLFGVIYVNILVNAKYRKCKM